MSENGDWAKILSNFKDFAAAYPNDVVAIGGVAVYLHVKNTLGSNLLESSHDVDFYISLAALSALRDLEEVVPNRRLGKSQIVHEGVEYDVYVERNNKLAIPYDEIVSQAVNLDGIRCAALGHLLILKCEAAKDRQNTAKGDKDFRDIAGRKLACDLSLENRRNGPDRLQPVFACNGNCALGNPDRVNCRLGDADTIEAIGHHQ